jgi:hypothetical protein
MYDVKRPMVFLYRKTKREILVNPRCYFTKSLVLLLTWPFLYLIFFIFGSCYLKNLKYSVFYKLNIEKIEYNAHNRVIEATKYFSQDNNKYFTTDSSEKKQLCIGILTVPRPERYFLQTMHSLLANMSPVERSSVYLFVVPGAKDIEKDFSKSHHDDVKFVSPFVDAVVTDSSHLANHIPSRRHSMRLSLDYAKALRQCRASIPYTLILEDDTIASRFFFNSFLTIIQNLDTSAINKKTLLKVGDESRINNWGSLKLYNSECFFGWERTLKDVIILISLSTVCSIFLFFVVGLALFEYKVKKQTEIKNKDFYLRQVKQMRSMIPIKQAVLHFVASLILVVCLFLSIGKQNIFKAYPKNGIHVFHRDTVDAFTVATLFQTKYNYVLARDIEQNVLNGMHISIDLFISQWAIKKNMPRLYRIPSLFQHIGFWSTDKRKRILQKRLIKRGGSIIHFKDSDTFV